MISPADYRAHDGLGLAALVRSKQVSAAELLETAIAIADGVNPRINALSQRFYDLGRASLGSVDANAPFAGVPFLLKDGPTALKGTRSNHGSTLFADSPPAEINSTLTERFLAAGLVIFAKTTSPELGLTPSTESNLLGATRNPWNLAVTAGGSSGGAAAVVAAGVTPIAHGSDGGGSIRIPAACCGLFGLKPTRARTPVGPLSGEGWGSLSANHVLTRTVRDSAAMLDAIAGPAAGDPYQAPLPGRPFLQEVGADPGRLRIALHIPPMSGVSVHPDCEKAARDTANLLRDLGHDVEEAQLPGDWEELGGAMWTLAATNLSLTIKRRVRELGRPLTPDVVDPMTWSAVAFSDSLDVEAYPAAVQTIHRQGRRMAEFHRTYDLILSPTLAQPPMPLGILGTNNTDYDSYLAGVLGFMPYTQLFNMTGQPSASIPSATSAAGLPIGVMLSAPFGDEATLLRVCGQIEAAQPWADRRPQDFA